MFRQELSDSFCSYVSRGGWLISKHRLLAPAISEIITFHFHLFIDTGCLIAAGH